MEAVGTFLTDLINKLTSSVLFEGNSEHYKMTFQQHVRARIHVLWECINWKKYHEPKNEEKFFFIQCSKETYARQPIKKSFYWRMKICISLYLIQYHDWLPLLQLYAFQVLELPQPRHSRNNIEISLYPSKIKELHKDKRINNSKTWITFSIWGKQHKKVLLQDSFLRKLLIRPSKSIFSFARTCASN